MDENFLLQIGAYLDSKGVKTDYEKLKKLINADPMMAKLGIDSSASKQQIKDLASEIHKSLDGIFKNAGIDDMKISIKDVESIINGSFKKSQEAQNSRIKEANDLLTKEKNEYQSIQLIQEKISKLDPNKNKNEISVLEQQTQLHKDDLKSIQNKISTYSDVINQETRINDLIDARKKSIEQIDTINAKQTDSSNLQMLKATEQAYKTNSKLNDSIEITKIKADSSQKSLNNYTKTLKPSYIKENTSVINQLSNAFEKAKQTGDRVDYSKAQVSLQNFKQTAKEAGAETSTLTQVIKDNIGAFTNWYLIGGVVSGLIGNFKEAISTIVDVDTQLTEISKTSNLSGKALKQLGIDAYDAASKYGTTVQSYLSGYLEMSRGTNEKTAKGLAELSILAQSAGDMTAELANSYIIATNAAYGYNNDVSKLNAVLDSQNQITNRNQVSMTDLATATEVAGSQANKSGVQIDKMTAATGTMIATTKQGGEVAGRAYKAILMNLQQTSGKAEKSLNAVGLSVKETVNGVEQLRNPMDILKDLAKVYNSLPSDSTKKANLISSIGGKVYHVMQKCIARIYLIAGNPSIG